MVEKMGVFGDTLSVTETSLLIGAVGLLVVTMALFRSGRSRLPPGPRRWPVVGNIPQLTGDRMFYEKLNDLRKQYGDIVFLTLGSLKIVVVYGHDNVKELLGPRDEHFKYRPQWLIEIQKLELFKGMVWSNGECNYAIREFARPVLYPGVGDKSLEQRVQEEAKMILKDIAETNGKPVNLMKTFHRAICNINYSIIFGARAQYDDPDFLHITEMMDQLLQRQGIKNPLNFFPILRKLPQGKKARHSQDVMKDIKEFIKDKIEKAKKTYDKNHSRSLLDMYIQRCKDSGSDDIITDESIYHITRDLFVAGSENVAIALQWLIAYIVCYPELQTKCRDLVKSIVGDNIDVSIDDMKKMPFIEATINEILRLSNIAPLSVPHATQYETELNGYVIPKDTMVLTHLESVHMDQKYWDDPTDFKPERFLQDSKVVSKEAYYPFSRGSRYCPAEKLAMMELFIIFCKCLQAYSFKLADPSDNISLKGTQPGAFVEPLPFEVCCVSDIRQYHATYACKDASV